MDNAFNIISDDRCNASSFSHTFGSAAKCRIWVELCRMHGDTFGAASAWRYFSWMRMQQTSVVFAFIFRSNAFVCYSQTEPRTVWWPCALTLLIIPLPSTRAVVWLHTLWLSFWMRPVPCVWMWSGWCIRNANVWNVVLWSKWSIAHPSSGSLCAVTILFVCELFIFIFHISLCRLDFNMTFNECYKLIARNGFICQKR